MNWICTVCGEDNNLRRNACNACGAFRPVDVNFLFIGNPGVGKSTLLNGLLRKPQFKSGMSFGKGLTSVLDVYKPPGQPFTYMDTPGLQDVKMRKQAAEAITEALKKGGHYKIFFVMTLEAGRVRESDVTTMALVLDAAPITCYGIIINKLDKYVYTHLKHNPTKMSPSPEDLVFQCVWKMLKPNQTTLHVHFMQNVPELIDEDNVVYPPSADFAEFVAFISNMPGMFLESSEVKNVRETLFEEKLEASKAALAQIYAANKRLEDALNLSKEQGQKIRKELADQKKENDRMAAEIEKKRLQMKAANDALESELRKAEAKRREDQERIRKISEELERAQAQAAAEAAARAAAQAAAQAAAPKLLQQVQHVRSQNHASQPALQPSQSAKQQPSPVSIETVLRNLKKEKEEAEDQVKQAESRIKDISAKIKANEERGIVETVARAIGNTVSSFVSTVTGVIGSAVNAVGSFFRFW